MDIKIVQTFKAVLKIYIFVPIFARVDEHGRVIHPAASKNIKLAHSFVQSSNFFFSGSEVDFQDGQEDVQQYVGEKDQENEYEDCASGDVSIQYFSYVKLAHDHDEARDQGLANTFEGVSELAERDIGHSDEAHYEREENDEEI